jgi:hypothetical protein
MSIDMVSISNDRLQELLKAEAKLIALEAAGVDNWEGYDEAMEILEEMENEEEE